MPIFVLHLKAELENVAKFWVPEDATWTFDVKQGAGSEERNGIVVDPDEEYDPPNSKAADKKVNFQLKFPGDKQFSSIRIVKADEKGAPATRPQVEDDTGLVPFIAFECRGLEIVRWHPNGPYCVESHSGATHSEVRLDEGDDWCDYDEGSDESMTVGKDVQYEFKRG